MDATPPLEPGLVLLEQPDNGALHRLVLEREVPTGARPERSEGLDSERGGTTREQERNLGNASGSERSERHASHEASRGSASERTSGVAASHEGGVLWVDAGGAATTYGLTARTPTRRALRGIRVARAFTAHQHHQLVRNAVAEATTRTGLVVAPNVATLYTCDDASSAELDRLFEASVALLAGLGDAMDVPVLVSAPRASEARRALVADRAEREINCEATDLGYAYDADGFQQTGYWGPRGWQTTIPYWVELCGAGRPIGAALEANGPPAVEGATATGVEVGPHAGRAQADLGRW